MKKSELRHIIKEEVRKILNEEYGVGDEIEIVTKEFPNYKFLYGTTGKITDIDKADYASDDLVYTINLKHIDPQGHISNQLYVDNIRMIK